jgi:CheY-like chemotaxis protein
MQKTVLIIEDNRDNYFLMQYLLEREDFRVMGADSGWLGIEMALYNIPDIILLDIQLPGMDGYTVMRRLRATPELAEIPIVAVSSYAMVGHRELAMACGASGYIEKPIDPDKFSEEIQAFLRSQK